MSEFNWVNPPLGYHRGPHQGQNPSVSGFQFRITEQGQDQSFPTIPQSPPRGYEPTPTVNRGRDEPPTDLQRWSGEHLTPFLRWAFVVRDHNGNARANYNYDPDINNAINLSETIVSIGSIKIS